MGRSVPRSIPASAGNGRERTSGADGPTVPVAYLGCGFPPKPVRSHSTTRGASESDGKGTNGDRGEPCVVRTRIPVWLLAQARRLGTNEADLLRSYPSLRAEDLANVWAYERAHREEIDRQIEENESA
jgi:uncharacterized protein (DUF433 family)